jgi:putative chitinase
VPVDNRAEFFACLRQTLAGGRLSQSQVDGTSRILDAICCRRDLTDRRQVAYILATAWHETGGKMQPVEENLNYSAKGLLRIFPRRFAADEAKIFARKPEKIANRVYAKRMGNGDEASGDGWLYRGRGLVQITGRRNYRAFGIERAPEKALDPAIATRILINGMVCGVFSGKKLADCFSPAREDWAGARAIVNGRDRAQLVAGHAQAFLAALSVG